MRRGEFAVVLAEAPTARSCKLAAVFCTVVHFAAFLVVQAHRAHPHTHSTWRELSPALRSSVKLASWAERKAKRPSADWQRTSPHFSTRLSLLSSSFFGSDPFLGCLYMYAWKGLILDLSYNLCIFILACFSYLRYQVNKNYH